MWQGYDNEGCMPGDRERIARIKALRAKLTPHRPSAPHDRTVFYLNDEEAAVILRMRKAVQEQRKLNRKRSQGEE